MSTNDCENSDDEQEVYDDLDNTTGSSNQDVHGAPVTSGLQSNAPVDWNHPHPTPYEHQNHGFPGQYKYQQYDYGRQNMMTSQYPQQHNHGQQNWMTSQFQNPDFVNQRTTNYPIYFPNSAMSSGHMTSYPGWGQSSSNATLGMNPVNDDGSVYDETTVNYGPFRESESDRIRSRMTHDVRGHPEHQFPDYEGRPGAVTPQSGNMSVGSSGTSNQMMNISPSQSLHSTNAYIPSSSVTSYPPRGQSGSDLTRGTNPMVDDGPANDETGGQFGPLAYIPSSSMTSPSTSRHLTPTPQLTPNTATNKKRNSTSPMPKNSEKRKGETPRCSLKSSHRSRSRNDPLNKEIPEGVKFDTKELCEEVSGVLTRLDISEKHFSQFVLKKNWKCAGFMLKKTEPLDEMTLETQHNFRRMYNWTQMSESQKQACFWKCPKLFLRNEFDAELPDNIVIDTANILRRVREENSRRGIPMTSLAIKVIGKTLPTLNEMLKKTVPWYNMTAVSQHNFRRLYNYIELPEETRAAFFRND